MNTTHLFPAHAFASVSDLVNNSDASSLIFLRGRPVRCPRCCALSSISASTIVSLLIDGCSFLSCDIRVSKLPIVPKCCGTNVAPALGDLEITIPCVSLALPDRADADWGRWGGQFCKRCQIQLASLIHEDSHLLPGCSGFGRCRLWLSGLGF